MLLKVAKSSLTDQGLIYKIAEEKPKGKRKDKINLELIKIKTHNINRLKVNKIKIEALLDYMIEENFDIIRLSETNITDKEGKWLIQNNEEFVGFWSNEVCTKNKGFGVGLLLKESRQNKLLK